MRKLIAASTMALLLVGCSTPEEPVAEPEPVVEVAPETTAPPTTEAPTTTTTTTTEPPKRVPSLLGRTLERAAEMAAESGFKVIHWWDQDTHDPALEGKVVYQEPAPGAEGTLTRVRLSLGVYVPTTTTTTTTVPLSERCSTINVDQVIKDGGAFRGQCLLLYVYVRTVYAHDCVFQGPMSAKYSTAWYRYDGEATVGLDQNRCSEVADIDKDDIVKLWGTVTSGWGYESGSDDLGWVGTGAAFDIERIEIARKR